jgi:hypothetical protein
MERSKETLHVPGTVHQVRPYTSNTFRNAIPASDYFLFFFSWVDTLMGTSHQGRTLIVKRASDFYESLAGARELVLCQYLYLS